ncbi:MAG: hypothetical protein LBN94_02360, partial [Puniceicoccales bacterium]|nr:hypothetical protein [Puniceicoccales bacterium]
MKKVIYTILCLGALQVFYASLNNSAPIFAFGTENQDRSIEERSILLPPITSVANPEKKKIVHVVDEPGMWKNSSKEKSSEHASLPRENSFAPVFKVEEERATVLKESRKEGVKGETMNGKTEDNGQHSRTFTPIAMGTEPVPSKLLEHRNSLQHTVVGDSQRPLIDLSSVEAVESMVFSEGDPADYIPWKTAEYYHFAKNQDLKELIRNFCIMQSMDVVISDTVNDTVNGKFSNITPYQFWKDIISAYGLVWFFDGSMMYVYKSSEVKASVYQMNRDEMRTLVRVIKQLKFLSSNVTFRPMETAGILVVSGPPKLISLIEELSKKIVIERVSDVYDIRSFPLKHAWAYDMAVNYRGGTMNVPGVASMLQQMIGSLSGPIGESNLGVSIDNSTNNKAIVQKEISGVKIQDKSGDSTTESKEVSKEGKDSPLNLGDIFITYDTRLNSVIVKAKRQDMPFIENIIQQLDVPRDALKIDVAVVDISKAGARKIGSTFTFSKEGTDRIKMDFSDKDAASSITLNFSDLFRGYSLGETLNILEDVGNAQTLTRSSVITLDNIGAVIDRSSTVYLKVAGNKSEGLYEVGISTKLIVVPHIIPGEFDSNGQPKIKLLIEVTDGSFDRDPRDQDVTPKTSTNSVNTEASIYEGQSLFIGGYFHETHSVSSKGFPFLKDIPILGHLFKSDSRDNSVMERIYIITPSIVRIDDPKNTQLNR